MDSCFRKLINVQWLTKKRFLFMFGLIQKRVTAFICLACIHVEITNESSSHCKGSIWFYILLLTFIVYNIHHAWRLNSTNWNAVMHFVMFFFILCIPEMHHNYTICGWMQFFFATNIFLVCSILGWKCKYYMVKLPLSKQSRTYFRAYAECMHVCMFACVCVLCTMCFSQCTCVL